MKSEIFELFQLICCAKYLKIEFTRALFTILTLPFSAVAISFSHKVTITTADRSCVNFLRKNIFLIFQIYVVGFFSSSLSREFLNEWKKKTKKSLQWNQFTRKFRSMNCFLHSRRHDQRPNPFRLLSLKPFFSMFEGWWSLGIFFSCRNRFKNWQNGIKIETWNESKLSEIELCLKF